MGVRDGMVKVDSVLMISLCLFLCSNASGEGRPGAMSEGEDGWRRPLPLDDDVVALRAVRPFSHSLLLLPPGPSL